MIVDLVRNDLGRVCVPGSIHVPGARRAAARTRASGTSSARSRGRCATDATDADLLRATFPPGSVTGAPKVAALDVIHELESTGREAYTGAIGFISPVAGLELNVAIRTFEIAAATAIWLGVGGGVVADSDPEAEAREAATKAAPLLDAIGATLAPPRQPPDARARPAPPRPEAHPPPRSRARRLRDDPRAGRRAPAPRRPPARA